MSENSDNLIMNLLRILTTEETSVLATISTGNKMIPLTEVLCDKLSIGVKVKEVLPSNVLPFEYKGEEIHQEKMDKIVVGSDIDRPGPASKESQIQKEEVDKKSDHIVYEENPQAESGEGIGFLFKKKKVVKKEKVNMSEFIFNEKKKFKDAHQKSKSKEILELYQKNSSLEIKKDKDSDQDLSKSSNIGLLVNKKQH